jgi:RNA polymerase primary sigma factor
MSEDERLSAYLETVRRFPAVGEREALELGAAIRRGDQSARKRLVEAHLRLVVALAAEHRGRGLSESELIDAGNLGLVRAVEGHDWERGGEFAADAATHIRDAIADAIRDHG